VASKFQLKKAKNGQFYFNLLATNGQIILTSEMYTSKPSANNGIASVKKNAPDAGRYDRRTNKGGKDYFVLKAANHQIIGNSEAYNSKAAMENGIKSVMKNAPGAKVEDLTA
jgi:uncharacterized protein